MYGRYARNLLNAATGYAHSGQVWLQELQNSILDLHRQLEEAKERESTLLAVDRQHKTDATSLTAQMNAAEQRAADTEHRLALINTDLKVSPISFLLFCCFAFLLVPQCIAMHRCAA